MDRAYVATDSDRVEAACRAFTDDVWLSKAPHASGTDRVAEIARELDAEIFVNVQTDEPMMDPDLVDALIELVDREGVDFASAVAPIHEMADFLDPNVVKVVCDARGDALYFSRAPIPWPRGVTLSPDAAWPPGLRAFKHIGIYAYRRDALLALAALPRSEAEEVESLEQLRVLDRGWKMRILEWDYHGIGVDTEQDLERLRKYIRDRSTKDFGGIALPGFEIFGDEERREVNDVLDTGVLFRYGFDEARAGHWKARTFEAELAARLGAALLPRLLQRHGRSQCRDGGVRDRSRRRGDRSPVHVHRHDRGSAARPERCPCSRTSTRRCASTRSPCGSASRIARAPWFRCTCAGPWRGSTSWRPCAPGPACG